MVSQACIIPSVHGRGAVCMVKGCMHGKGGMCGEGGVYGKGGMCVAKGGCAW